MCLCSFLFAFFFLCSFAFPFFHIEKIVDVFPRWNFMFSYWRLCHECLLMFSFCYQFFFSSQVWFFIFYSFRMRKALVCFILSFCMCSFKCFSFIRFVFVCVLFCFSFYAFIRWCAFPFIRTIFHFEYNIWWDLSMRWFFFPIIICRSLSVAFEFNQRWWRW